MEGEDTVLLMPDDRNIALKPIKWYKNLATRKGRLEAEAFLIEGDRTIKQIISSNPDDIIEIVSTEELSPFYHKYSRRLVTESQLGSICSTKTPQGIVGGAAPQAPAVQDPGAVSQKPKASGGKAKTPSINIKVAK